MTTLYQTKVGFEVVALFTEENAIHMIYHIYIIIILLKMRDQPFKKYVPIDKKTPADTYKYPTYQHYYQIKTSKTQQTSSPKKPHINSEKNIVQTDLTLQTPSSRSQKKSTKSSLKAQLESLKQQVRQIMQRKQGILKSPIRTNTFSTLERNKSDSQFKFSPSRMQEESQDEQSVSSQTLLTEPIKRLQLKAATQNYDHAKYMELENDMLKTELRNLKDRYHSKKRELNDKCSALQKKVTFLENSLYNSEQSLATELSALKEHLKEVEGNKNQQLIPTSDKTKQKSPKKDNSHSQDLQAKIDQLEKQLSNKNSLLTEAEKQVDVLKMELSKAKMDQTSQAQKVKMLSNDIQMLKKNSNDSMSSEEGTVVKDKVKKLYEELSAKNKLLSESEQKADDLQVQLSKVNMDLTFKNKKVTKLTEQLEDLRGKNNENINFLAQKQEKIDDLLDQLESQRSKQYDSPTLNNAEQWQQKLQKLRTEHQEKIEQIRKEYEVSNQGEKMSAGEKLMLEEEINYIKGENTSKDEKIEQLNQRIKQIIAETQSNEEKYLKILEKTEKKHEQALSNLHLDYQSKIMSLSSRRQKSMKEYSVSSKTPQKSNLRESNQKTSPTQEKEVRKWKLEYKQLKQKYQLHVKGDANKRQEMKEYYKDYRDYKQKAQIYSHKLKLFEKEFEKYLSLLTAKENELLKKQIQVRKLTSDLSLEKNNYEEEISALTSKVKTLQNKLAQQCQKYQKQHNYRQEIEQKCFSQKPTDESLQEIMERMKKRLIQQDEKYSKHVKQIKNKETLNVKLKQQLREVMQNTDKRINDEKQKQIDDIIEKYIKKEFDSFKEWKSRIQTEQKILQKANADLTAQIENAKEEIFAKDEQITFLQTELNNFAHSYNLKNMEVNQILQERENMINSFNFEMEEIHMIKQSVENIMQEELMRKSQQITNLRMEITAQSIRPRQFKKSSHSSFDDILKSHIEDNKKLREDIIKKTEEIFKLRDNYGTLRSQYQNLKSQIDINKLKFISENKNLEINYQVQNQKIKNELDMAQKKINLLEQKFKLLIQQNKKKDNFIQTYIVGKKLNQNDKDLVQNFIKQYEITVGSSDIAQRLASETQEIEKLNNYNKNLLREISALKEKILQFEAIDEEKVSVYDSKLSKRSSDLHQEIKEVNDFSAQPKEKLKKAQSLNVLTMLEHEF